ncbi:hypothetical protein EV715DRAFT_287651 [Schizophyllum commune]
MALLAEADIVTALEEAFDSLSSRQIDLPILAARWQLVQESALQQPYLSESTLTLMHSVGSSIASLADMMIGLSADAQSITHDLQQELDVSVTPAAYERDGISDDSRTSIPPYIAPCYEWLLDNLHNPYPSLRTKEQLLRLAREQTAPSSVDGVPTPPSSPRSQRAASSTTSTPDISLDDLDNWFIAIRARIGWHDICRQYFDGSRILMVQAARQLWYPEEPQMEKDFSAGCVAARQAATRGKVADTLPSQRSPHETVAFTVKLQDLDDDEDTSELFPPLNTPLRPDAELALARMEVDARELYAHQLEPSELANSLANSAADHRDVVSQPESIHALKDALARAASERQREARREQRRAKRVRDEMTARAEARKHYPSPEPASDDEESEDDTDSDTSNYDSDSTSESEEEDDTVSWFARSARTSISSAYEEESEDDDDSEDDACENADDSEDDLSDDGDSEEEEEDDEVPAPLAGRKRQLDNDTDDMRSGKRQRCVCLVAAAAQKVVCTHLPTVTHTVFQEHISRVSVRDPGRPRPWSCLACIPKYVRLSPPPAPVRMGPDGVPLGTVRPLKPQSTQTPLEELPCVEVHVQLPQQARGRAQPIKVSGDPTPYSNWDLSCKLRPLVQPLTISGDPTKYANWDLERAPSPAESLRSVSSQSSLSSVDSIFSDVSCSTAATEPEAELAAPESSKAPRDRVLPPGTYFGAADPRLFDPAVWSKYNLEDTPDGVLRQGTRTTPSAFVPTPVHVEQVDLKALPTSRRPSVLRSPVRLSQAVAAPVVSYQQAVAEISSPTTTSFGRGQLTSTLETADKNGDHIPKRRAVSSAKPSPNAEGHRRSLSPTTSPDVSTTSDLMRGFLGSGLLDLPPIHASDKTIGSSAKPRRRSSKLPSVTNITDPAEAARLRLAEIEREAARLDAERRTLQRLASVGG